MSSPLNNPLKRLQNLLPEQPLQVGTVVSVAAGAATITLPSGAVIQARGTAAAGQKVFVRNGLIEGQAPNLDYVEVEI